MYRSLLHTARASRLPFPPTCVVWSRSLVSSVTGPTNQHVSVDPEGKTVINLTFASEALGMPASEGYGWAQLDFGDCLSDRYKVMRKLGWGMHSSTWLAHDKLENQFVAVKALTGHITNMYEQAVAWEADALRLLSYSPKSPHCVQLLDEFTIPGKGSDGSHLCFVMPVYGGDVKALARSQDTPFSLQLAKRIILHTLCGLAHAHGRGVVHADLKHDNIFFSTQLNTMGIEKWIKKNPPQKHPQETSHDGVVQAAVSQPLPMISEEVALQATYLLADYGCAQPSGLHDNRTIAIPPLRAPESFLGGEWDKPADIWAFGCLVHEFTTSLPLFHYTINKKFGLTEIENMLYQMMLFSGEDFFPEQLQVWPLASKYFSSDCKLKKRPTLMEWPLELFISATGVVSREDSVIITQFIRRCLHLNPAERATAEELLKDPWFDGMD